MRGCEECCGEGVFALRWYLLFLSYLRCPSDRTQFGEILRAFDGIDGLGAKVEVMCHCSCSSKAIRGGSVEWRVWNVGKQAGRYSS